LHKKTDQVQIHNYKTHANLMQICRQEHVTLTNRKEVELTRNSGFNYSSWINQAAATTVPASMPKLEANTFSSVGENYRFINHYDKI
jgi:hypothetical protein